MKRLGVILLLIVLGCQTASTGEESLPLDLGTYDLGVLRAGMSEQDVSRVLGSDGYPGYSDSIWGSQRYYYLNDSEVLYCVFETHGDDLHFSALKSCRISHWD
jgi:hypothetical protein